MKQEIVKYYTNSAVLIFYVLILMFLTVTVTAQNDVTQVTKNISFHPLVVVGYKNIYHSSTFLPSTIIYSQPDTTSHVVEIAPFNKNLILLEEGEDEKELKIEKTNENTGEKYLETQITVLRWYEIELHDNLGFVKATEVATHKYSDNKSLFDYFIITGGNCKILKYDKNKKQFTDSLKLESRGDIVQLIETNGWKNTNMFFRVETINAYCGGGTDDHFIIDANGKLSELISTKSFADDGSADSYSSSVWLPIKFNAGKVMLIHNGDITNIVDTYSGDFKMFPFPKKLAIPKNELIVFKEVEVKSILNQSGEVVLNIDGSYKSKEMKNNIKYFRWNGNKLVQIR